MKQTALLKRAQKGDRASQMVFYQKYYKAVFNSSLRIVSNKEDAEDITHDVFIHLYQKKVLPHKEGQIEAWLRRISINKSIDFYRRKEKILLNDAIQEDIFEEAIEFESRYTPQTIYKAIQQLPKQYGMIVNLNLIEGYDHQEISDILNITSSASRSHLSRAKKKLKQILES